MLRNYNADFEKFFNLTFKADVLAASISLYKISSKFPYEIADIIAEEVRAKFSAFCCKGLRISEIQEIYEEAGEYYDKNFRYSVREYSHGSINNYRDINE